MDTEQLATEYVQSAHWDEMPPYLRTFLLGLERAGVQFETVKITARTENTHETHLALVTTHGLAVVRIEHQVERPGLWQHVVTAHLYDWWSIAGAELSYVGSPAADGTQWTLTVRTTPELSLTSGDFADPDGSKTRAFATAVLSHLSAGSAR